MARWRRRTAEGDADAEAIVIAFGASDLEGEDKIGALQHGGRRAGRAAAPERRSDKAR
jgi:hypothetical protein